MSNHTKGPWVIDGQDISPADDDRLSICGMQPVDDVNGRWRHGAETDANARLISAAPDLLDAIGLVLAEFWLACEDIPDEFDARSSVKIARAAIAKARGES